jgi:tetratricopeptide (TPR) repeat protein
LGRHGDAVRIVGDIVDRADLPDLVKADALLRHAELAGSGADPDFKLALARYQEAIKLVEPFSADKRVSVRRGAKHALLEAHLGLAQTIAWGYWQQKEKSVPKWLGRAEVFAEDLVKTEQASADVRLKVVRTALSCSVATKGNVNPVNWTKRGLSVAKTLLNDSEDQWRRRHIQWEVGLALYDALQADIHRGYQEHAITNATLVLSYLEEGVQARQRSPEETYLLGRLYFRIGSLHAVVKSDHVTAIYWFEKATPLLKRPLPLAALADLGQQGETFVSMGVTYWEADRKEDGLRLTEHGVKLMEQAVENKSISPRVLAIPYGNLSSMHHELGHAEQAESYASLAARHESTKKK